MASAAPTAPTGNYRWYVVFLLLLVFILAYFDRFILSLVVDPIKQSMGLSDFEIGLLLGPGGEFAFVGIGLAASLNLVAPNVASFSLAVTALSMALIPVMPLLARRLQPWVEVPRAADPALVIAPLPRQQHAIVVGYGRVGKVVSALLAEHGVPYTATDHDASAVADERSLGHEVYYGDATDPAFLDACGLKDAAGVIITIHARAAVNDIVASIRRQRPDVLIVTRARDAEHARQLYQAGATDAVPETIEASLQLSEAALVGLGIATGPVIASIHEQRDRFRKELQSAAQESGKTPSYSLRSRGKTGAQG